MKLLFAALLVGASVTVFAQTTASVGVLDEIKGLVSVSTEGTVTSATTASILKNGSVVLTADNSSVVVRLDNNCTIKLKSNEVLKINNDAKCAALIASVKTISTPVAEIGGGSASPFLIAAGVVGSIAVIHNVSKNKASGS